MTQDVLELLREANPVRDDRAFSQAQIDANVASIIDARWDEASDPGGRWPHRRLPAVSVAIVASIAAVVLIGSVVGWPWSDGKPSAMAYGVTRHADGSVDVLIHWVDVKDTAALQRQLQAAGIPAVVLAESPAGTCNQPRQTGIAAGRDVIVQPGTEESTVQRDQGFVIRPALLPSGTTIVVEVPFPGEVPAGAPGFVAMYVTDQVPPTCIPQSVFVRSGASSGPASQPSAGH